MRRLNAAPSHLLGLALLLSACGQTDDKGPPSLSITSPAVGQAVSGTVSVQVAAADDTGVKKVSVYARSVGSQVKGVPVGSATQAPFAVSWFTPQLPNFSDLELYAVALDTVGNEATSDPVKVKVQNPGLPVLGYFVGFNLPPDTRPGISSVKGQDLVPGPVLKSVQVQQIKPPAGIKLKPLAKRAPIHALAADGRTLSVQWGWPTYPGAEGYGLYLSAGDIAGPYTHQRNQAAGTAGDQTFSRNVTADEAAGSLFGAITVLTQNRTVESGLSNADGASFMGYAQQSASPADGQKLLDGRPVLTWNANPQAQGYLYYIFDKNPFDSTGKIVWTNAPRSTDDKQLSATYPNSLAPLPSGTYYWWVAGVEFNGNDQADAFSFSAPKSFVVP